MLKAITELLFFVIVLIVPLWLILYYITRWKSAKNELSVEELQRITELQQTATQLQERVTVLEAILDSKIPDWRKSQ